MKYGYKEIRTISACTLRSLCIEENWYTSGTNEEYENLLNMTNKDNITTDDIVEMATDIIEHSDEAVKFYKECAGLTLSDCYTHVMFLIAEKCNTYFAEDIAAELQEEIEEIEDRLDSISNSNSEAEQLLDQLNSAIDGMSEPLPFDPGNLKDLVIYDYDGETVAKFPMEHTIYQIHEGKLLVEYNDGLHTYRLDRFDYYIEGR